MDLIEKFQRENIIITKPGYYLICLHDDTGSYYFYTAWGSFPSNLRTCDGPKDRERDFYSKFKEISITEFLTKHPWYHPVEFMGVKLLNRIIPNFPWQEFNDLYTSHPDYEKIDWSTQSLFGECSIMVDVLKELGKI